MTDKKYLEESLKKSEEATENAFESWIVDLEEQEQPEACNIDDPDCENCGS